MLTYVKHGQLDTGFPLPAFGACERAPICKSDEGSELVINKRLFQATERFTLISLTTTHLTKRKLYIKNGFYSHDVQSECCTFQWINCRQNTSLLLCVGIHDLHQKRGKIFCINLNALIHSLSDNRFQSFSNTSSHRNVCYVCIPILMSMAVQSTTTNAIHYHFNYETSYIIQCHFNTCTAFGKW